MTDPNDPYELTSIRCIINRKQCQSIIIIRGSSANTSTCDAEKYPSVDLRLKRTVMDLTAGASERPRHNAKQEDEQHPICKSFVSSRLRPLHEWMKPLRSVTRTVSKNTTGCAHESCKARASHQHPHSKEKGEARTGHTVKYPGVNERRAYTPLEPPEKKHHFSFAQVSAFQMKIF